MPIDNRLMVPRRNYDADALRYLNAVQLADGQALEPEIQAAVDAFVRGCKADGIWDALKASCILCGARTISGALVPLVGVAPTPFNFASGDYDRSSGLKGNGSTKYLDTNRADNADPQDSHHLSVYATAHHTRTAATKSDIGQASDTSLSQLVTLTTTRFFRNRSGAIGGFSEATSLPGFQGVNRPSSSGYTGRYNQTEYPVTAASVSPSSNNHFVFARNVNGTVDSRSDARLAFYSIGSSLDLALLDNRVSTLVSAIAAAI
jgi:hypothetical protein